MSTRSDIEGLGGDDDNQRPTPPSKTRSTIDAEINEGLPVAAAGGGAGVLERTEQSRVEQDVTIGDATATFSVVFSVATSITFNDSSIDNYAIS